MKYRRELRFHGLRRPRIRQTWNKYNLFNLARLKLPPLLPRTFFQQKWTAKAMTRGYHGEHIKERQWERMFSRRLTSVVNMDPKYMAQHDGSEQAAGRGSGREEPPHSAGRSQPKARTPYMQMTYAPQERRLDVAIFRALFASSARQARQFVVHGAVKVNGKKMIYPHYLLNPGDMFQVDAERVMTGTGQPKTKSQNRIEAGESAEDGVAAEGAAEETGAAAEAEPTAEDAAAAAEEEAATESKPTSGSKASPVSSKIDTAALQNAGAWDTLSSEEQDRVCKHDNTAWLKTPVWKSLSPEEQNRILKLRLGRIMKRAKEILSPSRSNASPKHKRQVRDLTRRVRVALARAGKDYDVPPSRLVASLIKLVAELGVDTAPLSPADAQGRPSASRSLSLSETERTRLARLIQLEVENPVDETKPYKTPWAPRRFMSPFAFIPRYLEVNQNICAAVYLRHPVARLGSAEVPTPFPSSLSQLAFNWYLRRR